ncbi:hypothetical protein VC83_01309 [Pseudogymnoascus destructans]|uniref:Uncharacterized protein n=1 Tax=Pseudogymnoascus destructans TaxID=655981 RepID=A0A177AJR2_9PEZI|nr:uncharacterized protein VC83_01309 [Pseudogymnoascus destructans]OAF62317.1 hypothetical protein VC83_01309 [Pseudogymnoascus destructans]
MSMISPSPLTIAESIPRPILPTISVLADDGRRKLPDLRFLPPALSNTAAIIHISTPLSSSSLASAAFPKLQPGYSPNGDLLTAHAGCTTHSTCDECYGNGYVICAEHYCFDLGKGQRCCVDGFA